MSMMHWESVNLALFCSYQITATRHLFQISDSVPFHIFISWLARVLLVPSNQCATQPHSFTSPCLSLLLSNGVPM